MHNPTFTEEEQKEFLLESNAIEGVYDSASYHQAKFAWEYLLQEPVLTVSAILKAHKILMLNQPLQPDEKGYFRRVQVYVSGREMLDWRLVPSYVQMKFCFEGIRANPPIDPIALHVVFEKIHPFVDGNGRIGRLLMNWQFTKVLKQPLKIFKADERQEYYKLFA